MFGYRPDGRRLKDVDPIVQITPYLMPMRCDAQVFLQHNLDYEKMSRYIAAKSREGEKITFTALFLTWRSRIRRIRKAWRPPCGFCSI